jgi:hypothetical protein
MYPDVAANLVRESGSSENIDINLPWYPFALAGIHLTQTILTSLDAGVLQKKILLNLNGSVFASVARICQDLYGRRTDARLT